MPVTFGDRLPLPNLKVYTAGSVLLLSVAVYYALSVTSDPNWRLNATLQKSAPMADGNVDVKMVNPATVVPVVAAVNGTRNVTDHILEVMTFMMQEPLCMWTLINIAYCCLALFGFLIQRMVFGQLRVAEAQRVKDKFWNYVFYKFIFVFGVINVQYMDEVLLWCSWFTLVGFLHLLGQLCKDRFEYLSSSPNTARWEHASLISLLSGILSLSVALLAVAFVWGLSAGRDTFAFMAAECVLVLLSVTHVVASYILQMCEADVAGPFAYYTHLIFDSMALVVELLHVVHMVVYSNMLVSMASLVLLMQLRHLLHELQARARRHRLYTSLATHLSRNYPMASKEEVDKNQDNCAICWEPMKEARKLPCSHLFHNSCLCQWVQQDASCPTCRRALSAGPAALAGGTPALAGGTLARPGGTPAPAAGRPPHAAPAAAQPPRPNHLFHFDGSRYVSWLPSFSVEVTRVRLEPAPLPPDQIEAMARQVQQLFPQYALGELARDLAASRSADRTLDNILEGRLPARLPARRPAAPGAEPLPPARPAATPARPARAARPAAAADAYDSDESPEPSPTAAGFPGEPSDRETSLQRRKRALVAAARRRYFARRARPGAAAARPGAAPARPGAAPERRS